MGISVHLLFVET